MEEPDAHKSGNSHVSDSSSLDRSTSRRSTPGRSTSARSPSNRSTPGRSISGRSTSGRSTPGWSNSGMSTSGRSTPAMSTTPARSTPDRSTTPEPPPVPPATYHWEEVKRKRSVGGYPWTHLNKPPFDENTWVKYERDHVYEPVTPAASTDRILAPVVKQVQASAKDDGRHFLRIPLTEELVMADDTGSEPESEPQRSGVKESENNDNADEDEDDKEEEDEEEENDEEDVKKKQSDESIYEGENENSSVGDADANKTRMKMFQQKVKVKADILRTKLQGVTKRKPKQKIVVDAAANGEKSRRKFGQFATLPKKFTFNAPKVNFSTAFANFTSRNQPENGDNNEASTEDTKSGRFSMPRFGRFSRTSSESPRPSKSTKIGASRMSISGFRSRTWSDASKTSKPETSRPKIMDFGTYPRIFSKRRKINAANKAKTPPPLAGMTQPSGGDDGEPNKLKDTFRRRFFRTHKESTPAPTEKQTATLAVEEELDESHVSKESLAEFGDSDLQEVISLSDDCSRRSKDTKSLSDHRPGVIEEIDSDEFFLREKGLSRGDVHISNYLSSEIRDVFRSNRTWSVEGVNNSTIGNNKNHNNNNNNNNDNNGSGSGFATPLRPSRTNSLKRTTRSKNTADGNVDRFSTMPKSFGGTKPAKKPEDDDVPENIITSQTFEPSQNGAALPSTFRVPWRTSQKENLPATVTHMPPKPPTRHRMTKFSTFDTRSMIDLSRKRSQSQIGFLPSMNFSETVPKAPLRRSRTSLAGSERDVSMTRDIRPPWAVDNSGGGGGGGSGAPTPPLRRSRMSLTTDADVEERSVAAAVKTRDTPPRPPPPTVTAGYATVDKSQSMSLLHPPQSPVRHRRKKSYDVIKSQEFGAFFTIPRSYTFNRNAPSSSDRDRRPEAELLAPPSRPARAYNTIGPSRPLRRRLPTREHEYGDVVDTETPAAAAGRGDQRKTMTVTPRSSSLDDGATSPVAESSTKALFSGDVIEKMKLRPLPSPPPPPRIKTKPLNDNDVDDNGSRYPRRNTDSALVPFLDQRETSVTSSDDFFADVSRALLASAAKNTPAAVAADDVSVGVQTDPLPDGYELDDASSCCSGESDRPRSVASSSTAAARPPTARTSALAPADRPTPITSTTCTEYVDRSVSRMAAVENGYVTLPRDATVAGGVICAQRISVNELQVRKMTVAELRGQRMGVDDVQITHMATATVPSLKEAACAATAMPSPCTDLQHHQLQDDAASVQSSRVSSSMYPEVDSEEDRSSVLAAPTPPRRRSKPSTSDKHSPRANGDAKRLLDTPPATAVDLSTDPSITELSCQLFRLCHSNVCSMFNKVVQQVVPEDTEKRRDLQAALCFLSIILAGMLILGFGNEKTIHHHHWDFQFPPSNQ